MRAWHWTVVLMVLVSPGASATASNSKKDDPDTAFGLVKTWNLHLRLSAKNWAKMQPARRGGPFGGFGPGGVAPKDKPADPGADRKGRGMFGFDFQYVKGDLEIGGTTFKDVAVRFKGNSSYATSQSQFKRPIRLRISVIASTRCGNPIRGVAEKVVRQVNPPIFSRLFVTQNDNVCESDGRFSRSFRHPNSHT